MKKFWIKERQNPQTGTYFVPMGQMTKAEAKKYEKPLYGKNIMHSYESQEAYNITLDLLKKNGSRVRA